MKIPETLVEQIKLQADMVEVIGTYVKLKKRGRTYVGLCPFHHEKTPSFHVNPVMGIYKCFGCGAGGDIIRFLIEHEKYSYVEALKFLAEKYNIPFYWQESDFVDTSETESLYIVNQFAQQFFTQQLWESQEGKVALDYLKKRGIKKEWIEKFQLGYAPAQNNLLMQEAIKKQYELKYLLQTGLIKQNEDTQQYYDTFKGRLMFPIHTPSGKIAGFAGRILTEDKNTPKYLNSTESPIYHKSSLLYGLFHARMPIRKNDEVFLTEGYLDVISLHQSGIENAVASSGTAFTEEQAQILTKLTKNITIFYDGDTAGKKASFKAMEILLPYNAHIQIIPLPSEDDPDSFAQKHTPDEVKTYLQTQKQDAILYKFEYLYHQAQNDPNQRSKVQQDLLQDILLIPNPITQQEYIYQIARIARVPEEHLFREFQNQLELYKKQKKQSNTTSVNTPSPPTHSSSHYSETQEREILRLLLLYGDTYIQELNAFVFQILAQEITQVDEEIKNPYYQQIYKYLMEQYQLHHSANLHPLIHHEDKTLSSIVVDIIAERNKHEYSPEWIRRDGLDFSLDKNLPKSLQYAILYLRKKNIEALIQENLQNLKSIPADDHEKIEAHLRLHQNLILIRSNILSELGIVIS
ncbi:MAG: DNA primase [Bacteroidia bacterium]|nr:DNA primase [Bacteroidia bacterium]MDW8346108.1 DNA primase [Bacteroidia bacterium]